MILFYLIDLFYLMYAHANFMSSIMKGLYNNKKKNVSKRHVTIFYFLMKCFFCMHFYMLIPSKNVKILG